MSSKHFNDFYFKRIGQKLKEYSSFQFEKSRYRDMGLQSLKLILTTNSLFREPNGTYCSCMTDIVLQMFQILFDAHSASKSPPLLQEAGTFTSFMLVFRTRAFSKFYSRARIWFFRLGTLTFINNKIMHVYDKKSSRAFIHFMSELGPRTTAWLAVDKSRPNFPVWSYWLII